MTDLTRALGVKHVNEEDEYRALVERHCGAAVDELAGAIGNSELQRRALCRYFRSGSAAGISTSELLDFLGVSSPSVLDRAGYGDSESQAVMKLVGEISDEEIEHERT